MPGEHQEEQQQQQFDPSYDLPDAPQVKISCSQYLFFSAGLRKNDKSKRCCYANCCNDPSILSSDISCKWCLNRCSTSRKKMLRETCISCTQKIVILHDGFFFYSSRNLRPQSAPLACCSLFIIIANILLQLFSQINT